MKARTRRKDERCRVRGCQAAPGRPCLDTRFRQPAAHPMTSRHVHLVLDPGERPFTCADGGCPGHADARGHCFP